MIWAYQRARVTKIPEAATTTWDFSGLAVASVLKLFTWRRHTLCYALDSYKDFQKNGLNIVEETTEGLKGSCAVKAEETIFFTNQPIVSWVEFRFSSRADYMACLLRFGESDHVIPSMGYM